MYVVHLTPSLARGGAEQVLATLVAQLHRDGLKQLVISFRDGPHRAGMEQLGVPVQVMSHAFLPWAWWRMACLLRRQRPDCLHTTLWSANQLGRVLGALLGIPVVSAYHNLVSQDGFVRNVLDQLTIGFSRSLIAVSDDVRASLVARRHANGRRACAVIANGIETQVTFVSENERLSRRRALGIADGALVVGAVGRFVPVKRFDQFLVTCAGLIKDGLPLHVVLIGQGPEEAKLRNIIKKEDISDYVCLIVGAWAQDYYCLFDFLVLPSVGEGFGLVILEAFRSGLPCIVMHEHGVHPVVRHNADGIVVPKDDWPALAAAMRQLCAERALRHRLGMHAQKTVCERFSAAKMAASYKNIFQSAIYSRRD